VKLELDVLSYALLRFVLVRVIFVDRSFWPRKEDDPRNHTNQHENKTRSATQLRHCEIETPNTNSGYVNRAPASVCYTGGLVVAP
jgi:hypothetical protein